MEMSLSVAMSLRSAPLTASACRTPSRTTEEGAEWSARRAVCSTADSERFAAGVHLLEKRLASGDRMASWRRGPWLS